MYSASIQTDLQSQKWQEYPDVLRDWPLDSAHNLLHGIIQKSIQEGNSAPRVLVCGGGGPNGEGQLYSSILPDSNIVVVDLNAKSIEMAVTEVSQLKIPNLTIIQGDIADRQIQEIIQSPVAAATMIGLLTNLIDMANVLSALENVYSLLDRSGKLIISDCFLIKDSEYWAARYTRDLNVLVQAGLIDSYDLLNGLGTIIIRPNGLSAVESISLSEPDLLSCVKNRNFERLTKHRTLTEFYELLNKTGFKMEQISIKSLFAETVSNRIDNCVFVASKY